MDLCAQEMYDEPRVVEKHIISLNNAAIGKTYRKASKPLVGCCALAVQGFVHGSRVRSPVEALEGAQQAGCAGAAGGAEIRVGGSLASLPR